MSKKTFSIYGTGPAKAGEGLLSSVSQQANVSDRSSIQQIPATQLHANALNQTMSMDDLAPLKDSIAEIGLQQPLVVTRDAPDASGTPTYRILSGHRRFCALCELQAEKRIPYNLIPCIVKDLAQVELPISAEAKEKYAISTTNIENRTQTFSDRVALMHMMIDVYHELKAVKSPETIAGRRAFLAKRLKLSGTQIQDLLYIDKNIVPEGRALLDDGQMTLTAALALAHQSPEDQRAKLRFDRESAAYAAEHAHILPKDQTPQAEDMNADGEWTPMLTRDLLANLGARFTSLAELLDVENLSDRQREIYAGYAARVNRMLTKMEKKIGRM